MTDENAAKAAQQALSNYNAEQPRAIGDRWVTMTNALTRASHGLTLSEKRLVMLAISKIDSRRLPPQASQQLRERTRITATDYAEAYDITTDTSYEQLQSAAKHLRKRFITFFEPASRRSGKPLPNTLVEMNWVSAVRYQRGEGWIELSWNHELLPSLMGLTKQFTSYQLQQASALRSIYSWKLLELLMRFRSTGIANYSIEDFCKSMGATATQSADFAKIRTQIIAPSVKELTEKDNWKIDWTTTKAGRKVTGLQFKFERNKQQTLAFDNSPGNDS